jgi:ribulose-phosphate 3-epimerase
MFSIIPSILSGNPEQVRLDLERLGNVILPQGTALDRVQIDINDGAFLGVKTITPGLLSDIDTNLNIDFHLMTQEPVQWIDQCVKGGADRIIGQIEKMNDQASFVNKLGEDGIKVGLAVDVETEIERLNESILESLDVVLLMSYPAGVGGQKFEERVLQKVRRVVEIRGLSQDSFEICVDGGIGIDNIKRVKMAGADEVVIGKALTAGNIEENLEKFYKAIY